MFPLNDMPSNYLVFQVDTKSNTIFNKYYFKSHSGDSKSYLVYVPRHRFRNSFNTCWWQLNTPEGDIIINGPPWPRRGRGPADRAAGDLREGVTIRIEED